MAPRRAGGSNAGRAGAAVVAEVADLVRAGRGYGAEAAVCPAQGAPVGAEVRTPATPGMMTGDVIGDDGAGAAGNMAGRPGGSAQGAAAGGAVASGRQRCRRGFEAVE